MDLTFNEIIETCREGVIAAVTSGPDTAAAHEIAQAGEISRLRSALAQIEGASGHAASATTSELDRGSFRLIERMARETLDGANADTTTA